MKKQWLATMVLAVVLCMVCVSLLPIEVQAAEVASGTCGDNLTWALDMDGTLTISGTGEMPDFHFSEENWECYGAPWHYMNDRIISVVIEDGVTNIGQAAFGMCSQIKTVSIPESVTIIESYAFRECSSLTNISLPGSITSIKYATFAGCDQLTTVNIPDGVTTIGAYAFEGCDNLSTIDIPFGVTYIEEHTFSASGLTNVVIPSSVNSIGDWAFSECNKLTTVDISEGVTSIGLRAFEYCSGLTTITLPDSITRIEEEAFSGCSGLTSITIPNSIADIEYATFRDCSSLVSIIIPDGIVSIGERAFAGCSGAVSISIPDSVYKIDASAFAECAKLESIIVAEGNPFYHSEGNCLIDTYQKKLVAGCNTSRIPADGSVVIVGNYAFSGRIDLAHITIPDGVAEIGHNAFEFCQGLKYLSIPKTVVLIGESAFQYCSSLTSITIPDTIVRIEDWTFKGCSSLVSIVIPDSVISVGYNAFDNCNLWHVLYKGTELQWSNIEIDYGNDEIEYDWYANRHYNCTGDEIKEGLYHKQPEFAAIYLCCSICEDSQQIGLPLYDHVSTEWMNIEGTSPLRQEKTCFGCDYHGIRILSSVKIAQLPDKLTYQQGEELKTNGMYVMAEYDNGDTVWIPTGEYALSGYDATPGVKVITVSYGGKTATFEVTVIERTILGIGIAAEPVKKVYLEGEAFEPAGMKVIAFYNNNTSEEITDYTMSGYNPTPGVKTIIVSYGGKTATFNVTVEAKPAEDEEDTVVDGVYRIYGSNRFDTAFGAANMLKETLGVEKFENIIVACGTNFADALAGSYLGKVKNAPILLVQPNMVPAVRAYIEENLQPGGTVYLLGGETIVPGGVSEGLSQFTTKRLWGANRYETNLAILEEAGVTGGEILVCTGYGFADSLSASAVGKPILLVDKKLTAGQEAYLASLTDDSYVIVGGVGAVNEVVEESLRGYGAIERLAGANRFATSVMVAERFFDNPTNAVVAYAANFPDGLCGGPLAMSMGGPLLLTANNDAAITAAYTEANGICDGVVLGGPGLISDAAVRQIFGMEADAPIIVK